MRYRISNMWAAAMLATGASCLTLFSAGRVPAATLVGTTYDLRLLGHVQHPATDPTHSSTEGYDASPAFNSTTAALPNTIAPSPIPPFSAASGLRVSEQEAMLSDEAQQGEIRVRGPATDPNRSFTNTLNPNIPVELDLTLRFSGLEPVERIVVTAVRGENGLHGVYEPASWQFSGLGTAADPLLLAIRLNPADIQGTVLTSHVQVYFDWRVALRGDFNLDDIVDAADYTVWRDTGGTPEQFAAWKNNFGATSGLGTIAAEAAFSHAGVPEPGSLPQLFLALWAYFVCRSRCLRSRKHE